MLCDSTALCGRTRVEKRRKLWKSPEKRGKITENAPKRATNRGKSAEKARKIAEMCGKSIKSFKKKFKKSGFMAYSEKFPLNNLRVFKLFYTYGVTSRFFGFSSFAKCSAIN